MVNPSLCRYASVAGPPVDAAGAALPGNITAAYDRPWFRLDMTSLFAEPR